MRTDSVEACAGRRRPRLRIAALSFRDRLDWLQFGRHLPRRNMRAQGTSKSAVATRLLTAIRTFARSEVGWKAKLMFAAILVLLIGANGLNVANSFVNRNLMSAIAERHTAQFVWQAAAYACGLRGVHDRSRSGALRRGAAGLALARIRDRARCRRLYGERNLPSPGDVGRTRKPGSADRRGRARVHRHHAFLRAHGDQ